MAPDAVRVIQRLINITWKGLCSKEPNRNTMNEDLTSLQLHVLPLLGVPPMLRVGSPTQCHLSTWCIKYCVFFFFLYNLLYRWVCLFLLPLSVFVINCLWQFKRFLWLLTLELPLSCVLLLINKTKVASEPRLNLELPHTHTCSIHPHGTTKSFHILVWKTFSILQ